MAARKSNQKKKSSSSDGVARGVPIVSAVGNKLEIRSSADRRVCLVLVTDLQSSNAQLLHFVSFPDDVLRETFHLEFTHPGDGVSHFQEVETFKSDPIEGIVLRSLFQPGTKYFISWRSDCSYVYGEVIPFTVRMVDESVSPMDLGDVRID